MQWARQERWRALMIFALRSENVKRKITRFALIWAAVFLNSHFARAEERWIEVKSPHFTVISNSSEGQAREVAYKFEQIYETFAHGFPQLRTDSGAETIVLAVRSESDLKALLPKSWGGRAQSIAGLFNKGWERDYAIIRLDFENEAFTSIYHEYIHKLLELNYARLPVWLDEGLSEFYGTARFEKDRTILGAPSERLSVLRSRTAFPLEKLIDPKASVPYYTREDNVHLFYAEVWGLTHFLMFGKGMGNGQRLNEYMHLLQAGNDSQKAFQEVFGDIRKVQDDFGKYVSQFSFFGFMYKPAAVDKRSFQAKQLSVADTDAMLADVYRRSGRDEEAEKKLKSALAADPKSFLAHENMGFMDFATHKDEDARREFAEAAELDPKDYLVQYYLAMTTNDGKADGPSQEQLEKALQHVVELNAQFAPAYVEESEIYAREGKIAEAVKAALEARRLEPDRAGYHTNAAAMLLLQHDYADAIKLASYAARRFSTTDSAEALDMLNLARKLAGFQPTAEEKSQESELMKYAADTVAVRGKIISVSCSEPEKSEGVMRVTIDTGEKKMEFRPGKEFGAGFSDTVWFGRDHFNLCHRVVGYPAIARYKPKAGQPGENELRSLEIRSDLDVDQLLAGRSRAAN
jgi:Flp pilus assembly protein TadD